MKYKLLVILLIVTAVACSPTVTIPPGVTGRIVFIADKDDKTDIYTSDIDGQNLKRLTNTDAKESGPKWSPDGKKIAFVAYSRGNKRSLFIMNADGSNPVALNTGLYDDAYFPEWSPDGKKIVFANSPNLVVLDLETGTLLKLTSYIDDFDPSWSPDGKKLVFVRSFGSSGLQGQRIFMINEDGSDEKQMALHSPAGIKLQIIGSPSWAPDGKTIAFGNIIFKSNSPDLGPFREIAINTGIQQKLSEMFGRPATILTFTMLMQPDGSGVSEVSDQCAGGAWSPDSKWLLCTSKSDGNNNSYEIYLVNVSSGNSFRLTDTPYNENDPDWAP